MKYKATRVGKSDHRDLFLVNRVYDDRQILAIAKKNGLRLSRPNGNTRYRGSRRLVLTDPKTRATVWRFENFVEEDQPTKIVPVPAGLFSL